MQDSDLDGFFAAARAVTPMPSDALLARIEADGLRAQARPRPVVSTRPLLSPPLLSRGLLSRGLAALGGLRVAAGLVTATLVGLWIGLAQPAALSGLTETLSAPVTDAATLDTVELIPAFDLFATES